MGYSRHLSDDHNVTPEERELVRSVGVIVRSQNNTTRHVQEAGLKLWMQQYAAYLAVKGNGDLKRQQLAMASRIARQRVSRSTLARLHARTDFQALVDKLGSDQVAATKAQFQSMLPQIADDLEWASKTARAKEDYKAIPAIVEPVLSRTIPKKDEVAEIKPIINVMIGGTFAKQYVEAEMQEVVVEELPPPQEIVE